MRMFYVFGNVLMNQKKKNNKQDKKKPTKTKSLKPKTKQKKHGYFELQITLWGYLSHSILLKARGHKHM